MAAVLALVAAAALTACGSGSTTTGETGTIVSGDLVPLAGAPEVYSDVSGEADIARSDSRTTVEINASGLQPETAYIAHLHTGGCDQADPGGPHFQFEKGGSEKPPNEFHLTFTSNASGEGEAQTSDKREVPAGEAGSVVLHVDESHEMTSLEGGEAETVFVHEGVDHSKEGPSHEDEGGHHGGSGSQHSTSDKIACAELEGAAASEGGSQAGGDAPMIIVRNGEPVGGVQELEFDAGEEVRFQVSSDEAEEIHVHGYDLAKNVPAGRTVEFAFPAELEGIYEVELEGQAVQIAELRINP
jgi:hypothetical protein